MQLGGKEGSIPDKDDFVKAGWLAGHVKLGRYAGKPEGLSSGKVAINEIEGEDKRQKKKRLISKEF
jgi:hypothetical protein